MNYCSDCGAQVKLQVPPDDDRPRHVCTGCQTVHYQNPKMVTGVIATWQGKLLLCRRAIEPRLGYWTIPAGYLENGETLEEGARREAWEEARAKMETIRPFAALDLPHIQQIYFLFTGELSNDLVAPGPESKEVQMFLPDQIPWSQLAFSVVGAALQSWLQAPADQGFRLLSGDRGEGDASADKT